MQTLTAAPRDSLTAAQVTALLTGPQVAISTGCELLAQDLSVTADISDDLQSGQVSRNNDATIHGTVKLELSRELSWGTDLVRPYMLLSNGTLSARFNLGVYSLTTPVQAYAETPATYDCQGYDRLFYLNRLVGDSYSVAQGADVLTAIRQAFTDAGLSGVLLDGSAAGKVLPTAKVWPITDQQPATWLQVINALLDSINYRAVWCDWDGLYRAEPYSDPSSRGVEWTFDENVNTTIQGEDRTFLVDIWNAPNKWTFRQSNRDPAAPAPSIGDGLYVVDESANDPRGLVWASIVDYDVADQSSLVGLGDRRVAADKRVQQTWKLNNLGPFPLAWHYDIATLVVGGASYKVQGNDWEMDLSTGLLAYTFDGIS